MIGIFTVTLGSCKHVPKGQAENNVIEIIEENLQQNKDIKPLPKIESIDVTNLLRKEIDFCGMIGDDIQRMEIVFLSTKRMSKNEYEVIGKSKVKNNICDFKGVIEVLSVEKSEIEGKSDESPNIVDGKITGKYHFLEDKSQPGTGSFDGVFEIYWAYDDNDTIGLADIWYTQSDYTIVFDGSWKSYQTGKIKKACWSDYKACFPDDFNRSDGPDLIPDEKYRSKGWGDLIDMFSSDLKKRENAEKEFREHWQNWWK